MNIHKNNNQFINKTSTNLFFCFIVLFQTPTTSHATTSTTQLQQCQMTRETVACVPSLFDADKNNDGQITSYEYVTFANNLAGEELFVGFPVSLLVSFSKLSCLCHYLGEPETCCTNGQPHITLDGWDDNNISSNVEMCYFNDVCSVTQAAVDHAHPTTLKTKAKSTSPTPSPTIKNTHHLSSSPSEAPTIMKTTSNPTITPTSPTTTHAPSTSPTIYVETPTPTKSIKVFNGEFPITLKYSIQNDAGLSGDDIFFGTDGNNVKGELIEATSKMAQEVSAKLFGGGDCDNLDGDDCHRHRMMMRKGLSLRGGNKKEDTRRELKVTYDPTILPQIDQIFTVDCPDKIIKEKTDFMTCANVISTVFIQLEDEQSPTDIGSLFRSALEEQIEHGGMQKFLPEDSSVSIFPTSSSQPTQSPTPSPTTTTTTTNSPTSSNVNISTIGDNANVASSSSSSQKKAESNMTKNTSSSTTTTIVGIVVGSIFIVIGLISLFIMSKNMKNSSKTNNDDNCSTDHPEVSLRSNESRSESIVVDDDGQRSRENMSHSKTSTSTDDDNNDDDDDSFEEEAQQKKSIGALMTF